MRFARSRASFAGLPGSGGWRYQSNSGKLLVIEVTQHPPLAVQGRHAPGEEFEGEEPSSSPRQISVFLPLPHLKKRPTPSQCRTLLLILLSLHLLTDQGAFELGFGHGVIHVVPLHGAQLFLRCLLGGGGAGGVDLVRPLEGGGDDPRLTV